MNNTPASDELPVDSAAAATLGTVVGEASPDNHTQGRKKVVLAREPSDLDPTRYGDWEKNGRCIDF